MSDAAGAASRIEKSASAFRTISEVSQELDVPQHVLRFWETKFSQVKPLKRAGGRRYYRPEDISLLRCIRDLLYADGFTIRGVQKRLREKGVKGLVAEMEDEVSVTEAPEEQVETVAAQPAEPAPVTPTVPTPVENAKVPMEALRSGVAPSASAAPVSAEKKAELAAVKDQLESLLLDVRTARRSL